MTDISFSIMYTNIFYNCSFLWSEWWLSWESYCSDVECSCIQKLLLRVL